MCAVEAKRGCGYRKAGGIYLVTSGLGEPCERLPAPMETCFHCGEGIKQSRSFRWMTLDVILAKAKPCSMSSDENKGPTPRESTSYMRAHCPRCIVCTPGTLESTSEPKDKVGLLWVGEKFYPDAAAWGEESSKMGVSRRIAAIPKGLVVGKTWIFVAHPKAIDVTEREQREGELFEADTAKKKPGIFHGFIPQRVELVVTPSMEKEEWVQEMVEKQGVTLVQVPEDDPDHAPTQTKQSPRKKSMDKAARNAAAKKPPEEPPLRKAQ